MKIKKLFFNIKNFKYGDKVLVSRLYSLSTRSLVVAIALAALITIGLQPILGNNIVYWFYIFFLFTSYRLYYASLFKKKPQKYDMVVWHRKFIHAALISASIFSSLGFLFFHQVNDYYQLFIYAAFLGLSSGSLVALSPDIRLSIGYITILLFPLIVLMLLFHQSPLSLILALSLPLYFIAQVITIYKIYIQKQEIEKLRSQHILLDTLFKNAPLGVFTYNKNLEILDCNKEFSRLFNHDIEKIIGMNLQELPDNRPLSAFKNSLTQGPQSYEGPYISLRNEHFLIEAKAFSFSDRNNEILGGVGIIEDKTKEYTAITELEYMAQHDVLTNLLNRRGFTNRIKDLVSHVRHKKFFSILFYLDLKHFKGINDSLGHTIGDEVLLAVSKRLTNILSLSSIVSRFGGDEFTIMIPHIAKERDSANKEAQTYVNLIQNAFLKPCIIQEIPLHIQFSIGIILIEPKDTNIEEMIRHADLTMYQAKKTYNHVAYYDSSLDEEQKDLFILQHNLPYATQLDQLELFFQPIVKIKDDTLLSAELLIRWTHPTRGLLSPEAFIPLAIKADLLSKITWWIVDKLCQQIFQWKKYKQWKLEYISINIDAKQLMEKDFTKMFIQKLKSYDLDRGDIMLEITERSLIDSFTNAQAVINELRSHGVQCAIDDFGIGYSSLSYLKKLSFNTLKIDRSFIKDIGHSPKELLLVSSIVEIGQQFDYNIIIEGIENKEQKKLLLQLDENMSYQGYLFSKPLHADKFTKKFLT